MAAPNGQRGSQSSSQNHTTSGEQFKYQPEIFHSMAVMDLSGQLLVVLQHWILIDSRPENIYAFPSQNLTYEHR